MHSRIKLLPILYQLMTSRLIFIDWIFPANVNTGISQEVRQTNPCFPFSKEHFAKAHYWAQVTLEMKKNKHSIFNAEHKCSNLPHQSNVHIIWCCCLQCRDTYLRLWLLLIWVCIGKLHPDKILTQYDLISFIHLFVLASDNFWSAECFMHNYNQHKEQLEEKD